MNHSTRRVSLLGAVFLFIVVLSACRITIPLPQTTPVPQVVTTPITVPIVVPVTRVIEVTPPPVTIVIPVTRVIEVVPTLSRSWSATVQVRADRGWQDTGATVQVGDTVEIQYISGSWTQSVGKEPYHTGAVDPTKYVCANVMNASACVEPIPDFPQGGLIGRLGSRLLKVGNYLRFVAEAAGPLYLRMNDADSGLYDNAGTLTVRITVQPAVSPRSRVFQFTVQARLGWQDTSIYVASGERVSVQYVSGQWTGGIGAGRWYDADGDLVAKYKCAEYASTCKEPMPNVFNGKLIARVDSHMFEIGNYAQFSAPVAGRLFLRMNDHDEGLFDNDGAITVQITLP